jgi:hypothetical protein
MNRTERSISLAAAMVLLATSCRPTQTEPASPSSPSEPAAQAAPAITESADPEAVASVAPEPGQPTGDQAGPSDSEVKGSRVLGAVGKALWKSAGSADDDASRQAPPFQPPR